MRQIGIVMIASLITAFVGCGGGFLAIVFHNNKFVSAVAGVLMGLGLLAVFTFALGTIVLLIRLVIVAVKK